MRRPYGSAILLFLLIFVAAIFAIGFYLVLRYPDIIGYGIDPRTLHSLSRSQLRVLQAMKKIHEYRQTYRSSLVPIVVPSSAKYNMSLRETLLLEPMTMQLKQWSYYEQLLEDLPTWVDYGLDTIKGVIRDGNITANDGYLQERYQNIEKGCHVAIEKLQQHAGNLKTIMDSSRERLTKYFFGTDGRISVMDKENLVPDIPFHDGWIDAVKNDIGDLVRTIENTGHGAFSQLHKSRTAHLETVLLFPNEEESGPGGANGTSHSTGIIVDPFSNRFILSRPANTSSITEDGKFYLELLVLFVMALALGTVFEWMSLPSIFGYLTAGVFLGPSCLDQVQNLVQLQTFGQFCLLLIVFTLGSELSVDEILPVLKSSLFGTMFLAFSCIILMTTIATLIFGIVMQQAILCGFIFSFSSTIIVIRCLKLIEERADDRAAQTIMSILIMQDVLFCLALAVLPAFAKQSGCLTILYNLSYMVGKIFLYLAFLWLVSVMMRHYLPNLVPSYLGSLTLSGIFSLLGSLCGISIELGIFLAAIVISSKKTHDEENQGTINDFASIFFFTSIGLLLDLRFLYGELLVLLLLNAIVFCTKTLLCMIIFKSLAFDNQTSILASINLGQISELAMMLGIRGRRLEMISTECYYMIAGVTTLSMITSPLLLRIVLYCLDKTEGKRRPHNSPMIRHRLLP